ncbi:phosphotransferase family protein [Alcanivorax sp. JB21]|uniref:phosphotransferase family protein n=1 Tax=Alcanivorax limicola TaxID=2874102 RepID=UPI001CBD8893|nr:phosphotransferase family protein [Alcanivorax limicola]MBZ2187622.1 phosphotransferase family protein [Alcanivorax limicola]
MAQTDTLPFNPATLETWLAQHIEGFRGPIRLTRFPGGQSIPSWRIDAGSGVYVLRRKPDGPVLKGAHSVEREARVQLALAGQGFPVPRVYALCEDAAVLGTPFYVMDHVEGRIFWDPTFPEVIAGERAAYFDAMNATLAQLHGIDPAAAGLADYGRPGNFFARQIGLWSKQYLGDPEAGQDPDMDALVRDLPTMIPPGDEVVVAHGDFRCDNMIFHPREPRVIAVLDWELSTLGHPLADFAYHAMMYHMPAQGMNGLGGLDLTSLNIPDEAACIEAYCRRTGRSGIDHWSFYIAFNIFRLAAILHGIQGRVLRGTAASASARERAAQYPALARLANQILQRQ